MIDRLHPQLQQQLAAYAATEATIPIPLLEAISNTYRETDLEKALIQRQNEYLATLHDITVGMLNRHNLADLLDTIATCASTLLGTSHAYVCVRDPNGEEITIRAATKKLASGIGSKFRRGEGLSGRVWDMGRALSIYEYQQWSGRIDGQVTADLQTVVCIPLISGNDVIGVFGIAFETIAYTLDAEASLFLNRFAQLAALAIENANLYTELEARVIERTAELATINAQLETEIAERIHAERLRNESEASYRLLADHATDVISQHRPDGTYVYVSPASSVVLGYAPEELINTSIYGFLHNDDARELLRISADLVDSIDRYSISVRFRKPDGTYIWLESTTNGIRNATTGKVESIIAVSRDITARKRVETALEHERKILAQRVEERTADLRSANAELARAARMKDEFLASMSHELRTPLHAILAMSEAMLEGIYGSLLDPQAQALRTLFDSGQHLLSLINDILDLSKIEAGKILIETDHVEISRVCEASMRMVRQVAFQKQIQLHMTIDPQAYKVWADERRLKQILVNLLSNAVKFTPNQGSVGLHVVAQPQDQTVSFTVWDSGIGIAPEDLGKLFKPFMQLDSQLSRQFEGTGLGLVLVARMAALHGGSVSVESEPNKGSRFTVTLPWQADTKLREQELYDPLTGTQLSVKQGNHDSELLVLLVDDSGTLAPEFEATLNTYGAALHIVQSAGDALAIGGAILPNVIVINHQLAEKPSLELISSLRKYNTLANVPIITFGALPKNCTPASYVNAGANTIFDALGNAATLETLRSILQPTTQEKL